MPSEVWWRWLLLEISLSGKQIKDVTAKNILLSCVMFHRVRLICKNIFISLFAKVETVSVSVCHYHWCHYIIVYNTMRSQPILAFLLLNYPPGNIKFIKQSQVLRLKTLTTDILRYETTSEIVIVRYIYLKNNI